jgi:hypothetical protein
MEDWSSEGPPSNMPTGTPVHCGPAAGTLQRLTLRRHLGSVYSVTFSPDGTRLLCGSDVMTIWQALPVSGR